MAILQRGCALAQLGCAALLLAGCSTLPEPPVTLSKTVTPFSVAQPNGTLPGNWQPWRLSRFKRLTDYELVDYNGSVVVKAISAASASGLVHPVDIDPRETPILQWRWKVRRLIAAADNTRRASEDAPVRLVVSFDGDIDSLPLEDRLFYDRIRAVTGHQMPYATLMYIWENRAARGTIIPNPHSGRIQMIVAESGPALTGTWKLESQNVLEDYRRAFGTEPGRIKAIAIMTDTDNTGETAEAYYGDIGFVSLTEVDRVSLTGDPSGAASR